MRLLFTALACFYSLSYYSQNDNKVEWSCYDFVVHVPNSFKITQTNSSSTFVHNDLFNIANFINNAFPDHLESDKACKLIRLEENDEIQQIRNKKTSVCFLISNIDFISNDNNQIDEIEVKWSFYDVREGWDKPFVEYKIKTEFDTESKNILSDLAKSISESLDDIQRKVRSALGYKKYSFSHAFDLIGENYRNSFDIMFTDIKSNSNFIDLLEKSEDESIIPKNIFYEETSDIGKINSVFIINLESERCNGAKSNASGLSSLLSVKLMSNYKILDRSNLNSIIEEQKLNASGLTDESTIVNLGKLKGAEGILFCQESCLAGQQVITVKLLDCSSGEQKWIITCLDCKPLDLIEHIVKEISQ